MNNTIFQKIITMSLNSRFFEEVNPRELLSYVGLAPFKPILKTSRGLLFANTKSKKI
jgi:hypothetical protein